MGFIGVSHIEALRRTPQAEILAVADAVPALAEQKAAEYGVDAWHSGIEALLANPDIRVIHNCTPNPLPPPLNRRVIDSGRHIFSEKPLARSAAESEELLGLLARHPQVVAGVNFCYRMNPLVQDMKHRIQSGEIGRAMTVQGSYLQDWLLYDTDYSWRVEADVGGASRCVADIGSHWMDLAQTLLGSPIAAVCADTYIAHPTRKKAAGAVETFSQNRSQGYEVVPVETEDYAAVLVRFACGARGCFTCSEISAGRKCRLDIQVDGERGSFYWNQEQSDKMWKGLRDEPNQEIMRNPAWMPAEARQHTYLAAGHPEGWNDAQKNNVAAFYRYILAGKKQAEAPCDFATFQDAHHIIRVTEAIMDSAREGRWITL
jgi:predicted dehydrogenase